MNRAKEMNVLLQHKRKALDGVNKTRTYQILAPEGTTSSLKGE